MLYENTKMLKLYDIWKQFLKLLLPNAKDAILFLVAWGVYSAKEK